MKKITTLFTIATDCTTYEVKKIINDGIVIIITVDKSRSPYGVVSVIRYPQECEIITSPLLSIKNLICCSNCYGISPQTEYMNYAVQEGLKTSATAYLTSEQEYYHILEDLPDVCFAKPYNSTSEEPYPSMLYICRRGCLADYFDYKTIRNIYTKWYTGFVNLDWFDIKEKFCMSLEHFGDKNKCGFDLHSAPPVLGALLLGYPIETELAYYNKSLDLFYVDVYNNDFDIINAKEHFKTSNSPYMDYRKRTWIEHNGIVVCENSCEELYL